jgi:hypothetical protein
MNQPEENQPEDSGPRQLIKGEMSTLIHAHDWSKSGLGPMSAWPLTLRTGVSMILSLPAPATLFWGPDLIQI